MQMHLYASRAAGPTLLLVPLNRLWLSAASLPLRGKKLRTTPCGLICRLVKEPGTGSCSSILISSRQHACRLRGHTSSERLRCCAKYELQSGCLQAAANCQSCRCMTKVTHARLEVLLMHPAVACTVTTPNGHYINRYSRVCKCLWSFSCCAHLAKQLLGKFIKPRSQLGIIRLKVNNRLLGLRHMAH
jgi:hypothetical protein